MWKQYFTFVDLAPGKVITAQFGLIDFSADNIGIEILKSLYENDFPYLKITPLGLKTLYEVDSPAHLDLISDLILSDQIPSLIPIFTKIKKSKKHSG